MNKNEKPFIDGIIIYIMKRVQLSLLIIKSIDNFSNDPYIMSLLTLLVITYLLPYSVGADRYDLTPSTTIVVDNQVWRDNASTLI